MEPGPGGRGGADGTRRTVHSGAWSPEPGGRSPEPGAWSPPQAARVVSCGAAKTALERAGVRSGCAAAG